ncbi:uncharacterized protein LOC118438839 [Folsomia candida]|uniref:uncharacterized protein LOC118438839 n=1 Tax=Folsomia candida TaxID=158441 RepID=UPI00160513C2|nr:uncharacterized protein LOC118438839 [Folsomia candida]
MPRILSDFGAPFVAKNLGKSPTLTITLPPTLARKTISVQTAAEASDTSQISKRIRKKSRQALRSKKVTTAAEIKNIKRESARRIVQTEDEKKEEAFHFVMKYATPDEIERYQDAQGSRDYAEITRNDVIRRAKEASKI